MKVSSLQSLSVLGMTCLISTCHAFHQPLLTTYQQGRKTAVQGTSPFIRTATSNSNTALCQAKPNMNKNKKNNAVKETTPEKERPNGIALLFIYMTPWRNPNSIFVYMFGLLYALGKYSESH